MALAETTSVSAATAPQGTTVSVSFTLAGENLLKIDVTSGQSNPASNRTPTSVTYNGVAATKITTVADDGNFLRTEAWMIDVSGMSAGAHFATATFPTNVAASIGATGFTGADTASFGTPVAASSTSTSSPSVTIASASGEIATFAVASDANATITNGAGSTLLWRNQAVAGDCCFAGEMYTGASSVTGQFSASTPDNGWAILGISIKPSGGGGRTFFVSSGLDGLSTSGRKQFNPSLS